MKYDLCNDNLLNICKEASYPELDELCSDIREFLVDKVSKTGGHLASNLGIVELSVALMRVFDSPKDKIIYDVGHQSYVHKILTGRADKFDNLRQYKGISGFPKSKESVHDAYNTGHSSTSLSAAHGMAVARDLQGDDYNIVAVIGDGSMTGGIVYEALNNIGANQTNMNIILNDNGMSISHNVGAMSKYLNHLRVSEKYDQAKVSVKSALKSVPVVGGKIVKGLKTSKDKIKYQLINESGHIIEDLGIKYFGPVDGYNIEEMTEIMRSASKYDGPTLIHVITVKGKGYKWAEKYPRKFHGIGPFNVEDGNLLSSTNTETYSKVFGRKLNELAFDNKKICAVTAAMGTATGLTPFWESHPERYFDVGIAEEHAVVFAAGLAKNGYIPVVAIYSSFLQRAFDFMIDDVAIQDLHVVFAIDRAGIVGEDGETHHGIFDLSYLNIIPNMTILAPFDGNQLKEVLEYAINIDGPVALRYPRGTSESKHLRMKAFKGENIEISKGDDVTILAVGSMLDEAIDTAEIIRNKGFSVGIKNICIVKPMQDDLSDVTSKLIVTLEDNILHGGYGETLVNKYKDKDFEFINFGINDKFVSHGKVKELREDCGIDSESIARKVLEHFERKAWCFTCK